MTAVTRDNFGFLIAYVIPGFTVVATFASRSGTLREWLGLSAPTVGGFLYVTVAAVTAGMTLGAVRWLVLDRIHHSTGILQPRWDFARMDEKREAFAYLVEMHYRYYEFFGHMFLATLAALPSIGTVADMWGIPQSAGLVALLALASLFFVASRDTLRKYYRRTGVLLGEARAGRKKPPGIAGGACEVREGSKP